MSSLLPKQAPLLFGAKRIMDTVKIKVPGTKCKILANFIGRGKFSNVFYHTDTKVYIYTRHGDLSKDILAHVKRNGNPHVPLMKHLGQLDDVTDVYQTRCYQTPITRADPIIWKHVKALQAAHKQAGETYLGNIVAKGHCIDFNYYIAENADVPAKMKEALTLITEAASDWGDHYLFDDFRVHNLGLDKQGRLVFIDAMFDAELVQKDEQRRDDERRKRAKK